MRFTKQLLASLLASAMLLAAVPAFAAEGRTNIALGKSYTIESDAPNENSLGTTEEGGKDQLTDGAYGTSEYYSGLWAHFVNAYGRTVTIDLGASMSVDGVAMEFLQNKEHGVYCPRTLTVSLSENGTDFETVATVEKPVSNTANGRIRVPYTADFEKARARYVRVHFDVQVNTFLDEIEVYGGALTDDARPLSPTAPVEEELYFDDGADIGVRDIMCFHNGYYPQDETLVNNTKDVFRSYIGYVDSTGKYVDTMFDAIMFLTLQGLCPSGGKLTKDGGPTLLSDWEYLLDNTFGEGINLDALNEATAELKADLDLPDTHKTAVYLTVPYPKISDLVFGDWNGDGIDEKISTLDDCVDVYCWFVDECIRRFAEKGYEHLDFKGFFWCSESIIEDENDYEVELAHRCVEQIQSRGYQSVFIPYFQSAGSWMAEDIGFDATILQPNLSFNAWAQKDPERFMEDFVATAAKYHFGIQMEMKENLASNMEPYADYFLQYLVSASRSGMMTDAVHAYYQGAGYGSVHQCAVSSDVRVRWFYDALYKFVKGTLSLPAEAEVEYESEITVEKGGLYKGRMKLEGDWFNDFTVAKQALNGTVSYYPALGEFRYRPDRTYVGADSFAIAVQKPDGTTEELTVRVTVTGESDVESAPAASDGEASGGDAPQDKGTNWALIGGLAAGAVVLVGGIAAAVAVMTGRRAGGKDKKKKK